MNVLQLCQAACYESNLPAPSSLYGSTDPAALQLLNLFYSVGRELRQAKCWVQLKKTATITTSAGDTTYDLPTDFYASVLDTFWDQSNSRRVLGPRSDSEFNELLYGVTTTAYKECRIFGVPGTQQIQIVPEPGAGETLSFDYITKNWILHSGSGAEAIAADTDTCVFDDDLMIIGLKSRLYQEKGWEWESLYTDYKSRITAAQARFAGYRLGSMYPKQRYLETNIPDGTFG